MKMPLPRLPLPGRALASTLVFLGLAAMATPVSAFQNNFASASPFAYPATTQFTGVNLTTATAETREPSHTLAPGLSANRSVWANFTVTQPGWVSLSTAGSNFDTLLAVYTGASVKALKRIAADDDINPGVNNLSQVTFQAKPGVIYRVALDANGNGGTANVQVAGFTPLLAKTWYGVLLASTTEGSGLLTITTSVTGAYTGSLKQGTKTLPFTGSISPSGRILNVIRRTAPDGSQPAILDVTQSPGGGTLVGTIYADTEETNDNFSLFNITLLPAGVYSAASPCPRQGNYTFRAGQVSGIGFGHATVKVTPTGAVTVAGFAGDGSPFTLTGPILETGSATSSVFRGRQILGGNGHVTVNMIFNASNSPTTLEGDYIMRRGVKPGAPFLPAGGFIAGSGAAGIVGSFYTPPSGNTRMNEVFNPGGQGSFDAVSSAGAVSQSVNLSPTNTFTYEAPNMSNLSLTTNKANGTISGTVTLGGIKCTVKGVSINTPTHKGFYGFTSGPAFNGTMTIFPDS